MQLRAGTRLQDGKYEILRTLGQGGFGITYLAEQVALHRKVAIKEFFMKEYCERDGSTSHVTLGATAGSRELVARFRTKFIREAQMIAALEHPNIVKIHDIFEENGTAYYVMSFLEGDSLSDRVKKEGPLPEEEALRYIHQVAGALSYIHGRKSLHFDVKPSNILVNSAGEAVLIDFGISKHYDEAGNQTSSTPVGVSKGYAPLEQYQQNEISSFTPATDIYSLGATLYTLLTGAVPPSASEVNEDGLPPLPESVSKMTRNAIEKAMQPRRKNRPQSIQEFLVLLDGKTASSEEPEVTLPVSEETRIINEKPQPKPKPNPAPEPTPTPKSSKPTTSPTPKSTPKWLIPVLAGVAALVITFLSLRSCGKEKSVEQEKVEVQQSVQSNTSTHNGHEYVDLGLSVKWATCNVGASSPGAYGNHYAWGETTTKSDYSWETLKYRTSGDSYVNVQFSKYVTDSSRGTVDNKKVLDMSDDAARQNWGGSWRMPTDAEWTELRNKCTWTWTSQGGHNGYKVVSKSNGNSIFLPAAGWRDGTNLLGAGEYGHYWSSSLNESGPDNSWGVLFDSSEVSRSYGSRCSGRSVRPVCRP